MADEIYETVKWFSELMEFELRKHEKEKIPWTDKRVGQDGLLKNIVEHENKHSDALQISDWPEVIKQAVHIANNYMMVADLARREMDEP